MCPGRTGSRMDIKMGPAGVRAIGIGMSRTCDCAFVDTFSGLGGPEIGVAWVVGEA